MFLILCLLYFLVHICFDFQILLETATKDDISELKFIHSDLLNGKREFLDWRIVRPLSFNGDDLVVNSRLDRFAFPLCKGVTIPYCSSLLIRFIAFLL